MSRGFVTQPTADVTVVAGSAGSPSGLASGDRAEAMGFATMGPLPRELGVASGPDRAGITMRGRW